MNKRKVTIVISTICLVLAAFITIAYMRKENIIGTDNLFTSENSLTPQMNSTTDIIVSESLKNSGISEDESFREVLLTEGAQYTLPWVDESHTIGDTSDAYIKCISIKTTKENTGYHVQVRTFTEGPVDNPLSEVSDDSGNLTSNHTYVIVSINLRNLGERELETAINRFRLVVGLEEVYELRGYNADKDWNEMLSDYYHINLLPSQVYNYDLVYVVPDDILEKYENSLSLLTSFIEEGNGDDWRNDTRIVIQKTE